MRAAETRRTAAPTTHRSTEPRKPVAASHETRATSTTEKIIPSARRSTALRMRMRALRFSSGVPSPSMLASRTDSEYSPAVSVEPTESRNSDIRVWFPSKSGSQIAVLADSKELVKLRHATPKLGP
eukprot:scaffold6880_cov30-Tisochrysis_lutea.AAC.1